MYRSALFVAALALVTAEPCFSQQPGDKLWGVLMGWESVSSPAVAADGTIYVGAGQNISSGGALYSFSPRGTTNWVLKFPRPVRSSPSIGPDGRIYVGCWNGELKIVNPDGTYSNFATGGYIGASPAIGADGTVYIGSISNYFNRLFALTPDGALKWVFKMGGVSFVQPDSNQSASPAIGPDGTIYVGSIDKKLYAINPSGTTNWVFPLTSTTMASPSFGPDGTIYLGADNSVFYAIDPEGTLKWKKTVAGIVESSAAVNTDGTIYFGSLGTSGPLYAMSPAGTQNWSFASAGISSSPMICSDGSIYAASYSNNKFYALNAAGSNVWSFTMPGTIFSSPVIGPDGTIYLAAEYKLYAFYGTNTLAKSAWPMFRGNALHTARSAQRGIQAATRLSDGNMGMTFTVDPGRTYRVEYSSNLLDWAELSTFVADTPTNQCVDLDATNAPQRMYRLQTSLP